MSGAPQASSRASPGKAQCEVPKPKADRALLWGAPDVGAAPQIGVARQQGAVAASLPGSTGPDAREAAAPPSGGQRGPLRLTVDMLKILHDIDPEIAQDVELQSLYEEEGFNDPPVQPPRRPSGPRPAGAATEVPEDMAE
eukprot:EG_transcript_43015